MDYPSGDSSSDYIGKKSADEKATPPRQRKKGNAAAPSLEKGNSKRIRSSTKSSRYSYLVTVAFVRSSTGTVSKESQHIRITAAEENVLKRRFPGLHIEPYPKLFECDQVDKDDLKGCLGYAALLEALESGLPLLPDLDIPPNDGEKPLVIILAVNLARFGRNKTQLLSVVEDVKTLTHDKFDVEIMPLDCFGLPLEKKCIPALAGYYAEKERIDRKYGPYYDPGRHLVPTSATKQERESVESDAKIIKGRLEEGDDVLKQMIKSGIAWSANIGNTILPLGGLAEFESKYIQVAKEITKDSKLEGEQMKSFIRKKVIELAQIFTPYTGQKYTVMYCRRSKNSEDKATILAFDSVPAEQYAYGHADLMFHRIVPKEGELGIYFDDHRQRDDVTNPQYIHYLAAVLSGRIHTAVISEPNRIDRSRWIVELHQQACVYRKTTILFSKAIGKCVKTIALNEEMGKKAREKATKEHNDTIAGFREDLPVEASPDDGFVVTQALSKAMELAGSSCLNKNERKIGSSDMKV